MPDAAGKRGRFLSIDKGVYIILVARPIRPNTTGTSARWRKSDPFFRSSKTTQTCPLTLRDGPAPYLLLAIGCLDRGAGRMFSSTSHPSGGVHEQVRMAVGLAIRIAVPLFDRAPPPQVPVFRGSHDCLVTPYFLHVDPYCMIWTIPIPALRDGSMHQMPGCALPLHPSQQWLRPPAMPIGVGVESSPRRGTRMAVCPHRDHAPIAVIDDHRFPRALHAGAPATQTKSFEGPPWRGMKAPAACLGPRALTGRVRAAVEAIGKMFRHRTAGSQYSVVQRKRHTARWGFHKASVRQVRVSSFSRAR